MGGYLQKLQATFETTADGHLGPEDAKKDKERVAKLVLDAQAI